MHHEDKRGMFNIHRDLQNFVHKPRPNSLIEHSSVGTKLTKSGLDCRHCSTHDCETANSQKLQRGEAQLITAGAKAKGCTVSSWHTKQSVPLELWSYGPVLLSLLSLSCLHEVSDRVGKQNDICMGLADLCSNWVEFAGIRTNLGHLHEECSPQELSRSSPVFLRHFQSTPALLRICYSCEASAPWIIEVLISKWSKCIQGSLT